MRRGTRPSGSPLAFYVGSLTSFNVQRLLSNLGKMLSPEFQLHLLTTDPGGYNEDITDRFDIHVVQGGYRKFSSIVSYLRTSDPSVITQLTQPPNHGTLVSMAAAVSGVPSIYRYSGDRFYTYRVRTGWRKVGAFGMNNVVGRFPLALASKFVVLGPTGRDRLVTRGVDPASISILQPGIDMDRIKFAPSVDLDVPGDRHVAMFVGRRVRLKGIQTMRRAIPEIVDKRDDIQFVFLGDGNLELDLPSEYTEHVTMEGAVPPKLVPGYLDRADLLVHPSLTEGLPRAVLEALAAGVPVVTRDVGELASVTDNVFTSFDSFVEMVHRFESLEVDDVSDFSLGAQSEAYTKFFGGFVSDIDKKDNGYHR